MSPQSLVTIVIPVYNGSNFIRQAIDSAINQTYKNTEIIVVDDGSTDNTKEIIQSYGERIRAFHKTNGGVASALNVAITEMKGDFFSWLSHDDLYYPYKIEEQVYFYHSLHQEKAIIYSNDILIDDNGTIISKKIDIHNHNCLPFFLLYRRFIGGCSLLIPKKAFDAAGPFNEQYQTIQDYDMWYRMMNNGYSFRYLPIIAVKSRIHKGQTSNTKKKEYLEEKNKFFISVQEYLDPQLWIEKCNNKAICYFKLAIEFKLNGEDKVFYYDLKKGIAEVKKNKIKGIIIFGEFLISLIYQIVRGKISSFLYR